MEILISLLSITTLGIFTYYTLNKLPNISSPLCPGPYWHYFYFQIPLLIFPSVLAIHAFSAANSHLFNGVTDAELIIGSAWVIYGILVFSLSLPWLLRICGGWTPGRAVINDGIVVTVLSISLSSLMSAIYIKSGDLAILHLGDSDIGIIRKRLTTDADFSPYFGSALNYLGFFSTAYAGHLSAHKKKFLAGIAILLGLTALSWAGAKGPPVVGLLTFYFSFLWFAGLRVNVLKLCGVTIIGALGIFLMFALTRPDLGTEELIELITLRLFLGQMSGFYQAISFTQPDFSYIAPWVPFSGLLGLDQTPYARDLMISLYGNTDTNGYLNSIFLQDAWAGLGHLGLIISPLWMALSIAATLKILSLALAKTSSNAMTACVIFSFVNVNTLTVSFGQMALMKSLAFPLALFLIFSLACLATKKLLPKS